MSLNINCPFTNKRDKIQAVIQKYTIHKHNLKYQEPLIFELYINTSFSYQKVGPFKLMLLINTNTKSPTRQNQGNLSSPATQLSAESFRSVDKQQHMKQRDALTGGTCVTTAPWFLLFLCSRSHANTNSHYFGQSKIPPFPSAPEYSHPADFISSTSLLLGSCKS